MVLQVRANAGLHDHVFDCIDSLDLKRDDPILDYGAGSGAFLQRLEMHGFLNIYGADIVVPSSINGIHKFYALDIDKSRLDAGDHAFKMIISIEVIEHIENLGFFVGELARLLAPNGLILLTTPNIHSIEARLRYCLSAKLKQFDPLSDPTHISPVHLFSFQRLLSRYGLEIRRSWGFPVDGSSTTTVNKGLKLLSKLLTCVGIKGAPAGDHLCLLIARDDFHVKRDKKALVVSHYGS